MLKLHTFPGCHCAFPILITAEHCGVSLAVQNLQKGDELKPAFLELNPSGLVPALETPDGVLTQVNTIAAYVAHTRPDAQLFGYSFFEASLVDQWIRYTEHEILPPLNLIHYSQQGCLKPADEALAHARSDLVKCLDYINADLLLRTYLVGHHITLADIVLASAAHLLFKYVMDKELKAKYKNFTRWYYTIAHQPAFVSQLGEPDMKDAKPLPCCACDKKEVKKEGKKEGEKKEAKKEGEKKEGKKEGKKDEKKEGEKKEVKKEGKKEGEKKEGEKKEKKEGKKEGEKKEGKKEGEKKEKAPKGEKKEGAEKKDGEKKAATICPEDEKAPSVLAVKALQIIPLPPAPALAPAVPLAKFDIPSVRKSFTNVAATPEVLAQFWKLYDPTKFSLWVGGYKYNAENTHNHLTAAMIQGFVQRLAATAGVAVGAVCMAGEGPFDITPCLLVASSDKLPDPVLQVGDVSFYNWEKVDIGVQAGKDRVGELWLGKAMIGGKKFQLRNWF